VFDIAKCKPIFASALLGGCAMVASVALAHPPHSPYDDTVFAPIKRFGPRVAVEVVASGLVAPLKGVAAPGDRDHLYVVDQAGTAWKVNLHTKEKSVFLDVRLRIVTLGVCGPDSFDERGLLGVAFHPNYRQKACSTPIRPSRTPGRPPCPPSSPALLTTRT